MPSLPKPERLSTVKARQRRTRSQASARCVGIVWLRDGGICQGCGRTVRRDPLALLDGGHVHERVYRSRGGDATDPDNCVLLCAKCHRRAHGVKG